MSIHEYPEAREAAWNEYMGDYYRDEGLLGSDVALGEWLAFNAGWDASRSRPKHLADMPQYQEGGSATTDHRLVALPNQDTTKEK